MKDFVCRRRQINRTVSNISMLLDYLSVQFNLHSASILGTINEHHKCAFRNMFCTQFVYRSNKHIQTWMNETRTARVQWNLICVCWFQQSVNLHTNLRQISLHTQSTFSAPSLSFSFSPFSIPFFTFFYKVQRTWIYLGNRNWFELDRILPIECMYARVCLCANKPIYSYKYRSHVSSSDNNGKWHQCHMTSTCE